MSETYLVGQRVTLTWTNVDADAGDDGSPFDAATVRLIIETPSGTRIEPELENVDVGVNRYELVLTEPSRAHKHWKYRWEALDDQGVSLDAYQGQLIVRPSNMASAA